MMMMVMKKMRMMMMMEVMKMLLSADREGKSVQKAVALERKENEKTAK